MTTTEGTNPWQTPRDQPMTASTSPAFYNSARLTTVIAELWIPAGPMMVFYSANSAHWQPLTTLSPAVAAP